MAEFVGRDRIGQEPAAADDLAALCAYLPVEVAGETALRQYVELEAPEADEVRATLAAIGAFCPASSRSG